MTNTEGGTDDEEFRVAAIKDRVDTTMQVWMGLTMGCAKCHSHKFDPITHDEYYNSTRSSIRPPTRTSQRGPGHSCANRDRFWHRSNDRRRDRSAAQKLGDAHGRALGGPRRRSGNRAWAQPARPLARGCPRRSRRFSTSPADRRTKPRPRRLARYFRSIAPELKPVRDKIAALEKAKPAIPNVPVMVELPPDHHRVTHVLRKGNFLDPGDVVGPGVPQSLPSWPDGVPKNRLGLARWLVDPAQPPDGPGGRQSLLGPDLRRRAGRDRRRLRHPG